MVASVEESSDDTSSYVSVHINDDKSSMDEPEWQTVQPNIRPKKRMSAKERKDLKNVQRSERSAIEFAEGQNTVAEVAESFLRNLLTENDKFDDFTDEVVYFNPDGVAAKGRTMEELIAAWTEFQDKRKQEIDVLDEIASQYRGSGRVEDLIRQGNHSMQQRSDATFHRIVDLATRVRNARQRQILEAEQLMRQRQESPELSNQKDEVREERCFFSEPNLDSGFSNLLLNFSEDAEHEEAKYRRMDMVVDSGAFVSGVPPECYPEYKIDEMYEGGKSVSGEALPILGIRHFQVSLIENVQDLTMNVKVIKGLSKALGAVSEMVANNCRVVFDSESKGGSYIWNRNRDEYYKVFPHNGIYTMPVWVRIPANFDDDEKNSGEDPSSFQGQSPRTYGLEKPTLMSGKLKIHQMYACTMEQKTFQVEQTEVQMKEDSMKVKEIYQ